MINNTCTSSPLSTSIVLLLIEQQETFSLKKNEFSNVVSQFNISNSTLGKSHDAWYYSHEEKNNQKLYCSKKIYECKIYGDFNALMQLNPMCNVSTSIYVKLVKEEKEN